MKVSVDVARLRQGASDLDDAPDSPPTTTVRMGELGGARADAAFEQFYATWTSECSAAEKTIGALSVALRSAADTYEQRDAEDAAGLTRGLRAF